MLKKELLMSVLTKAEMLETPFPRVGFVRLPLIIGDRRKGIPPFVPVGRSTWWAGVKSGRFPAPVKLGPRTTVWRAEDILALSENPKEG